MASSLVRLSVIWPCSLATRIDAVATPGPASRRIGWLIENSTPPWSASVLAPEVVYCGLKVTTPPVASGTLTPRSYWSLKRPSLFCSCVIRLLPLRW